MTNRLAPSGNLMAASPATHAGHPPVRDVGATPGAWGIGDAREFVLSYRLERFVEGTVEIAMLTAVTTLFTLLLL